MYAAWHAFHGYIHIDIHELHQKYGSIVRIGPDRLVTDNYENYQRIYTAKNVHKAKSYLSILHKPDAWTAHNGRDKSQQPQRRQVIQKAINEIHANVASGAMIRKTDHMFQRLDRAMQNSSEAGWTEPVDFGTEALCLHFDVMGINCFGYDMDLGNKVENRFLLDLLQRLFHFNSAYAQSKGLMSFHLEKALFPRGLMYAWRIRDMIHGFRTRQTSSKGDVTNIFDVLTAARGQKKITLTDEQVWAELRFLMITGSSVTSSSLAGLFWYLARYPGCYETLVKEVRAEYQSGDEIIFGPRLNSCTYLKACMLETLRLAPGTQGGLFRDLEEGGITLKQGYGETADSTHVPEGYDVGVCLYAIQHNEKYFPNPFAFQPERWLSRGPDGKHLLKPFSVLWPGPKDAGENLNAFAAFSHGVRACLGRDLAMSMNMSVAARILWSFNIRASDDPSGKQRQGRFREGQFPQKDFLIPEFKGPWLQFQRRAMND